MMGYERLHILVAVLDWGWGHAMRCMPVIEEALERGHEITVASSEGVLQCLAEAFPDIRTLALPAYAGQYRWNNMAMNIAMKAPELILAMEEEQNTLLKQHQITPFSAIISDGRYGCFLKDCPSFFLSHQLHIKARKKLTDTMANTVHKEWLANFTEIWVPDFNESPGLGSQLSHENWGQALHFIGPLSRFKRPLPLREPSFDWLFLMSGPEPARKELEKSLFQIAQKQKDKKFMFVSSETPPAELENYPHISYESSSLGKWEKWIEQSKHILCRSDFCHLTDLSIWERTALLVPTPGHPEEMYLADFYAHHYKWPVHMQSELLHLPSEQEMADLPYLPSPRGSGHLEKLFHRLIHYSA